MVDISKAEELKETLNKLNEYAEPEFGIMTPQHIIEHLSSSVKMATGKFVVKQFTTAEEAVAAKNKLIVSNDPFPKGIKSPVLPEGLAELKFMSLQAAKNDLIENVEEFNALLTNNKEHKAVHPRMGELSVTEWKRVLDKHFTHHFSQYNLNN